MLTGLTESELRILDLLRSRGPLSRAVLARETDLAAASLSRLSQSLLERGLIEETHKVREGQRGKPGQLIRLHAQGGFAVGVALQSEYVAGCLIDLEGRIHASATRPFDAPEPSIVNKLISRLVAGLLEDSGVSRAKVMGAGVSMPGMSLHRYGVERPKEMDRLPDEFAAWRSLNLQTYFEDCTGLPTWLENSSQAAALAELHFGAGQRLQHFAVLHLAYGFGGGLVLQRRPYRGAFGRAGEFGGLFPYSGIRPSGRDLLGYLAERLPNPPASLRAIDPAQLPSDVLEGWLERIYPVTHELCRFLSVSLDLEALILNGLLPATVLNGLANKLRERLPRDIRTGFGVPQVLLSPLAESALVMGAAALPLHFLTSASSR